jgi:signal peptidase I
VEKMDLKEIAIYIIIIVLGVLVAHHMNVVASESMIPLLNIGDIVIVDFNPGMIVTGDIIVYNATWFESKPVIHRVVEKGQFPNGDNFYITQGDNNGVQDPLPVYPEQVISKVVTIYNMPLIIPRIGYITLWSKQILKIFFNLYLVLL